jgi:hypothetical protein
MRIVDGKVYFAALGIPRYATPIPAGWESVDGTLKNPHDYTAMAQTGTAELVCVDAEHGNLIWKCGVDEIGPAGPNLIGVAIADGRIYGQQTPMSHHIGVGDSRPHGQYTADKILNYEWFPPMVYCFGKGPTQFRDVAIDNNVVEFGESLTISGRLVDLSPPISSISSLSTYKRDAESPATRVPVSLSYTSSNGTKVPFVTLNTDTNGEFSYTWYPWETGSLPITVESVGNDSYEAPDAVQTTIFVESLAPDMVPLLTVALAVAVIAIAVLAVVYWRK